MRTVADDLAARARIRNAAVDLFGREGFGVGLRAIAEGAGVSLGLIRHHFGSKEELRAACDEFVLAQIAEAQQEQATAGDPVTAMLDHASGMDEFHPLVRYMVAALRAGGPFAHRFLERMIADSETYLAQGEEAGLIKPSVDPKARARFLVVIAMGGLLLEYATADPDADAATLWQQYVDRTTVPALELYTQGLLVDSRMLEAYMKYKKDPPQEAPGA